MADEWEETGSSGHYSLAQQAEDAVKSIQQREFRHKKTAERRIFYKYGYQDWREAIAKGQTRD